MYAVFLLTSDHGHRAGQTSGLTQAARVPPRKQTSILFSSARGLLTSPQESGDSDYLLLIL